MADLRGKSIPLCRAGRREGLLTESFCFCVFLKCQVVLGRGSEMYSGD